MAYNGKLPGKDEVANLIIGALRQDKEDVVINAEIQAEIDQPSFKAAEAQINKLTKTRKIDVDTSKAEQKLKNLIEPLREVAEEIKSLGKSGADFNVAHNTIKRYEQLKQSVSEATGAISKNNKELKEAQELIGFVEGTIKSLDITVEKATKKKRNRQTKKQTQDVKAQTEAIAEQSDVIVHESAVMEDYGEVVEDVTKKLEQQTVAQQKNTKVITDAAKAQEKLNKAQEKQLKLSRVKSSAGGNVPQTYTAVGGKYRVEKGSVGWNVYDNTGDGYGELIGSYEDLGEIRKDAMLIAEDEALYAKAVTEAIEAQGDAMDKIKKKALNMASAIKRYNSVARDIGIEHFEINDDNEDTKGWNLRDMVSQMQSELDTRYQDGNKPYGDTDALRDFKNEKNRVVSFINAYAQHVDDLVTTVDHFSKFDNTPNISPTDRAFAQLDSLGTDPYEIEDEAEVNRIYQERLDIIEKIGEAKLKAADADRYEAERNVNEYYQNRLDGFNERRDLDLYDMLDNNFAYYSNAISSSKELEELLEIREHLLSQIYFNEEESYITEVKTNDAIRDRIALMKELEPLVASGAISSDDLESIVFERGTLDEQREMLFGIHVDVVNADDLEEAQMALEQYEKILVTTASGKKLELGPDMSEADYQAFLRIDAERAKKVEFIRKEIGQTTIAQEQLVDATEKQKERLHEIYELAKQNEGRDLKKDRPNGLDALRQRIDNINTLLPQLKDLQSEVVQMGIKADDENFNASFAASGVLAKAIRNKTRDLEFYNNCLERTIKLEEFEAKAQEKYGITTRSKKFSADVMAQFKDAMVGLQNGLSVDDAMSQLDSVMQKQIKSTEEIVQLTDNYSHNLDEVNNKLMQGCKLLDKQGNIIRLFHNSPNIFDSFDASMSGKNQGQALGAGNYLALRQDGEFNDMTYGRYQTQWYANVQNAFKAGTELTSAQASSVIDKFLAERAEGFKNHMLSKLLDGDVITAIKDIADEAGATVGEVFGHIGYDAVMDGAQINVFDPSKIHRANNSVLDIGSADFESFRSLQQEIWKQRSIIEKANDQIEQLENPYSGKTAEQLEFDLFFETLHKGYKWHNNVAKIASAYKDLTGELPKSDGVTEESMRALVENYEFSRHAISQWQEDVAKHQEILDNLTSQFNEQKVVVDNIVHQYLTSGKAGIVNQTTSTNVTNKLLDTESGQLAFIEGAQEIVRAEDVLQEEIKETNAALEGQISLEEHLAEIAAVAAKQLEKQRDISELVPRDVIDKAMYGIDAEGLLSGYGLQGDELTKGADMIRDLAGARYLGDASPKRVDKIFNELFDFVAKNAQETKSVTKTLQDFRACMKLTQIKIPDGMEHEFAAEFTDAWDDIKKLYAIGGNSKNKKKLLTTSNYAETPGNLVEALIQNGFGYVFDREMMQSYNGNDKNALRMLLDAIQRAKAEYKAPNTQTIFGLDEHGQLDLTARLIETTNIIEQNVTEMEALAARRREISDELAKNISEYIDANPVDTGDIIADKNAMDTLGDSADEAGESIAIAQDKFNNILDVISSAAQKVHFDPFSKLENNDDVLKGFQDILDTNLEDETYKYTGTTIQGSKGVVHLKNAFGSTIDAVYRLKSGMLELDKEASKFNDKWINFDKDSAIRQASADVRNLKADLGSIKYDGIGELETAANNIASPDDVATFKETLKAARTEVSALKKEYAKGTNSLNDFSKASSVMRNATTHIERMRMELDQLGDVKGVSEAEDALNRMTAAARSFNEATNEAGQRDAWNAYNEAKIDYDAQYQYAKTARQIENANKSKISPEAQKIQEQYQSILDIVNKINTVNSNILKYQDKDGGSGILSDEIERLQTDKAKLMAELQEIRSAIDNTFVQGKEYSVPTSNITDGDDSILSFLNNAKTQASLTTEEIDKLIAALQKAQTIDIDSKSKILDYFKSVEKLYSKVTSIATIDPNNAAYQQFMGQYSGLQAIKGVLPADHTQLTTDQIANLQTLIGVFESYGNALVEAGNKEAKYFANKTRYTQGISTSDMAQKMQEEANKVNEVQNKLEKAAQDFASNSGFGDAYITKFTQSADGISKLDFSVFDEASGQLRNFSMEMGSVTDGLFVTESTISKALANIKAAQKQAQSMRDLIGRLGDSGVDIGADTAVPQVKKLLDLHKELATEAAKGDKADQGAIADLTRRSKLASAEVEKLYKQLVQMDDAIASGQARNRGTGDPTGDVYGQLVKEAHKLAEAQPNATLEIGRFDAATNTLNVSLVHANGTIENFQMKMNALSGQMIAQQAGVGKLTTSWDKFKETIGQAGKHLMTAVAGANVFYKALAEVRKGIGYVKEIDLALTELKKVTDETEESYAKFLKTASKTAGAIGSTVSDFTEASANFARLGYSMEESANMAKTAIVYKNVADGLDTVEAATDSIISTMKAFGIESENTMQIVDLFNEVGKYIAQ